MWNMSYISGKLILSAVFSIEYSEFKAFKQKISYISKKFWNSIIYKKYIYNKVDWYTYFSITIFMRHLIK